MIAYYVSEAALRAQAAKGPMDPAIKEAWLKKLEDPNAKQTTGKLRVGDSYCCLGLLCEVVRDVKHVGNWQQQIVADPNRALMFSDGHEAQSGLPPGLVYREANLAEHVGEVLASANDNGISFKDIAEFVRDKL